MIHDSSSGLHACDTRNFLNSTSPRRDLPACPCGRNLPVDASLSESFGVILACPACGWFGAPEDWIERYQASLEVGL